MGTVVEAMHWRIDKRRSRCMGTIVKAMHGL
jgi:hypothetical protein